MQQGHFELIKRFILSGTPGSGKTTVIQKLQKQGYFVIYESATDIIALEQKKGKKRPWEEVDFTDKIISLQKERQIKAISELQFYDRSPFCTYALGKYLSQGNNVKFVPSSLLLEEIERCLKTKVYQNKIFFFENLGFIESTDARQINYEDALIFEQIHLEVYKSFGFKIILVPKDKVKERCKFILSHLS